MIKTRIIVIIMALMIYIVGLAVVPCDAKPISRLDCGEDRMHRLIEEQIDDMEKAIHSRGARYTKIRGQINSREKLIKYIKECIKFRRGDKE